MLSLRPVNVFRRVHGARWASAYAAAAPEPMTYEERLYDMGALPQGFSIGTARFPFVPIEAPHITSKMNLTLIKPDEPTPSFAAMYTRNAFPGAPVQVGRRILAESEGVQLGAILVNNAVSNVCSGSEDPVADAIAVCDALRETLGLPAHARVLPSSTGVIGWRIPVAEMIQALPDAIKSLQSESALVGAKGIMTTDLFPKLRAVEIPGTAPGERARVVGFAKGAGMVEPNMATMLAFVLTDAQVTRSALDLSLREAVDNSFHCISVDSDTSTSDMVVAAASNKIEVRESDFAEAVDTVCRALAEDVVRNGEGVQHVIRVNCIGTSKDLGRAVGKSIVNAPLVKTAVAGNDPNVGRLVMAVGKAVMHASPRHSPVGAGLPVDLASVSISMGGRTIFENGRMKLNADTEAFLLQYLRDTAMYCTFVWLLCPSPSQCLIPSFTFHPLLPPLCHSLRCFHCRRRAEV
ncbi:unnamed protein product [Symbiodinium sp. KB8]|nr:unnamed protein product [Symbiodinium sp. KB8]